MSILLDYSLSFATGIALGLFFLQGLWLTLRGIDKARRPGLRLLGSMFLRFAVVLAAFYFLARYAGWQHVLAAVIGFSLLRLFIIRRFSRKLLANNGSAR